MSSEEFNILAVNSITIPEYNNFSVNAYGATPSYGLFIVPSEGVPGRPADVTGYFLAATNQYGKAEWVESTNVSVDGQGSIWFSNGLGNPVGDDLNLYWNDTTKRLGIQLNGTEPDFSIDVRGGIQSESLSLLDLPSEFQIGISPPTLTASYNLVLPVDAGTSGYVLATNGAGVLAWVVAGGGGSNVPGQGTVWFSDIVGGATGSTADFNWTGTHLTVNAILSLKSGGFTTNVSCVGIANTTFTLPPSNGSSGQVLTTNGSGVTTWTSVVSAPAGSNTEVQFNNAGAFGASANFVFTGGNTLTVTGIIGCTTMGATGTASCAQLDVGATTTIVNNGTLTTGSGANTITLDTTTGEVSGVEFLATSDINLKTNICPLEGCLGTIQKIKPYAYNWKQNPDGVNIFGVIAQQLESAGLGGMVKSKDNLKRVDYYQLIPLLIGAVQEMNEILSELKCTRD